MSGVLYRASDGRWVCLTMPETDRWWPGLAGLAGLDPADPRFDSHEKRCGASRLELIRVLEDVFRRRPASEWKAELDARRLSADVVEEFAFPAEDPQARRNRYVLALDHPSRGPIKTLGFPIFLSEAAARLRSPAPALGQHSAQLLHELLGFPEARIAELAASGVIESA
jgi:crotonobetainyl-CoA:carnitine CoA-transferase CaiB-like acyl-CoA transferase